MIEDTDTPSLYSMLIKAIDALTGSQPIHQPIFVLDGKEIKTSRQGRIWRLKGLESGHHELDISAADYLPTSIEFEVGEIEEEREVFLIPAPDYPFPADTMMRGQIHEPRQTGFGSGNLAPLAGVKITAEYSRQADGESYHVARVYSFTDEDGRFALCLRHYNQNATEVFLSFEKSGYQRQSFSHPVSYLDTSFCDLVFELEI